MAIIVNGRGRVGVRVGPLPLDPNILLFENGDIFRLEDGTILYVE